MICGLCLSSSFQQGNRTEWLNAASRITPFEARTKQKSLPAKGGFCGAYEARARRRRRRFHSVAAKELCPQGHAV